MELIVEPINDDLVKFRNLFDASLTSTNPLIQEVLNYVKLSSGKMMRPILVLLISKLYGKVNEATMHAALSLELLHTASLIHDDVVDESRERRGKPSVNEVYNNKASVLVGDFLLGLSLHHAAASQHLELVDIVAQLGKDLSEGEIIQLENTRNDRFSEQTYYDVIRKKTAALFRASAMAGAIGADAGAEHIKKAAEFGELLGISFQIRDDIFDYFNGEKIGKPTGNDMAEGKLTLPALYVLNHFEDETYKEIALKIKRRTATQQDIDRFVEYVKANRGIEYAEDEMRAYRDKALTLFTCYQDSPVYRSLVRYIDFVIERKK